MIDAAMIALATYLENAALSWMQLPDCSVSRVACQYFEAQERESPSVVGERIQQVSNIVAELLQGETPIWSDDTTGARTGLLLMHVAFHETRFRGYVWDGRCNDDAWRKGAEGVQLLRLGTCDGGHAYSPWQVHPERGFYLTFDGSDVNPFHGELKIDATSIKDPKVAAVAALHMLRRSVRLTNSLRYYTGEWSGPAPKAALRLDGALAYEHRRPFLPAE